MTPDQLEAFRTGCVLVGFDLPGFDKWLATLKGHPVHKELTERRALAWAAMLANEREGYLRHLEWMLLRWKWIRRADALTRLAQLGDKFDRHGRKRGSIGVVRKFVSSYMGKHPAAKTAEVWAALAAKPPRGVEVYEASGDVERYIRTPGKADTSYRQFQNIVSEERPKQA